MFVSEMKFFIINKYCCYNRPWGPSSLSRQQCSHKLAAEVPDLNPCSGLRYWSSENGNNFLLLKQQDSRWYVSHMISNRGQMLSSNEAKTEVCVFHKNDPPKITIRLQNVSIQSKKEMNVLGVIFDCKLNWNTHI